MPTKKIGTHNGAFHCDEVMACFMLKALPQYKDAEIIRTRNPEILKKCDIVVDVGGVFDPGSNRFDHHQKTFNQTMLSLKKGESVTQLSSAGLIYAYFGKNVIRQFVDTNDEKMLQRIYDRVYDNFIEEIDVHDNGICLSYTALSSRIANFRPAWNDAVKDMDAGFYEAMTLAKAEFVDLVQHMERVWWPARQFVADALKRRFELAAGQIISLETNCPWKHHLEDLEKEENIEGEILFCISEASQNTPVTWQIQSISRPKLYFRRVTLKKDWFGLMNEELSKISGVKGCVYVNSTGSYGVNKTKKGAIQMGLKSIEAAEQRPNKPKTSNLKEELSDIKILMKKLGIS